MKKTIYLSLSCAVTLGAADLGTIKVSEVTTAKVIENVSNEEVKNADLAEMLNKQVPSINLIRRSGIANDITLRGQKRDNIVVTVDDAKVCGACPNRMDPPTSHIVTANVDTIKVTEGPFDVEEFGNLSGSVKVTMKKPTKELKGEVETTLGSYGYQKFGAKVSGGTDKIQILLSGSTETSEQYKDGDGNTMAEQLENANTITAQSKDPEYQDRYKDMDAYTKKTAMAKVYVKVSDNQDLEASITANRSDDILYPNSKMDALYDDSNIYNLKYTIKELGKLSKKLTFKAYSSDVEHPMSTKYRLSSDSNISDTIEDSNDEVISKLTTEMDGFKAINDIEVGEDLLTIGLDTSKRNWNGIYIGYGIKDKITGNPSINDVDTINNAIFLKYDKNIGKLNIKLGTRFNDTTISTADTNYEDRDFNSIDANILATLKTNSSTKYFAGIGKASRVPDARELYWVSSMGSMGGTPTLDQTTNTELDIGVEKKYDTGYIKFKTFYSKLDNYIYFNKDNVTQTPMGLASYHSFENIDATIYGLELLASKDITDDAYVDFGASYKRGKKDEPLAGQTDTDLADITPFKVTTALNVDVDDTLSTKLEMIAAKSWDNYDSDNGEQELAGYAVFNIKAKKEFNKKFELTVGIDNILDKTYAVSNTYSDLTLIGDGTTGDVMLLNEPGRYYYVNAKFKF